MKRKTAREILAESFRELAGSKPVDKNAVPNIIENCGYSKTTFYRLFKDKYDLMAWDYARRLQAIVVQTEREDYEWKLVLWDVAFLYNEQKDYLRNLLLHTSGYESFSRYMKQLHKVAELTGPDRKVVDKAFAAMKKEGSIVSPVRCKWEPAEK